MSKTILITRPKKQSFDLSEKLTEVGHDVTIEPLFEIQPQIIDIPKNPQAILITSMNAVFSLSESGIDKKTKILAVGERTAQIIKEHGFENVSFASCSSSSLRDLAINSLSKEEGVVVYLSGNIITLDLSEELLERGFKTKRIISYIICESQNLSDDVILKIKNNLIENVLIYSQNTALIFHKLLTKHNLLEYCQFMNILCLSDKISDFCLEIGFKKVGNIREIIHPYEER